VASSVVENEKNGQNLFCTVQNQSVSHGYIIDNSGVFNFDECFLGLGMVNFSPKVI
jgi:hypothetical protein